MTVLNRHRDGASIAPVEREYVFADEDVHCLQTLALNEASDDIASALLCKLSAGRLISRGRIPLDVVSLNCTVEFRLRGELKLGRIVHPRAIRSSADISVLSALGTALIGLRVGQSLQWPEGSGACIEIMSVAYAAGAFEVNNGAEGRRR